MNWFGFLKNKSGKLTVGLPQLAVMAGVVVVAYSAFQADRKAVEEKRIRSLSSIENSYNYGGLRQGNNGLTSINIKDALNQVANSEDRARLEGENPGDFGLGAIDRMEGSLTAALPTGRAAQTSATDGLGMGGNETDFVEGAAGPAGGANRASVNPGAINAQTSAGAGRSGAQLGTASMARASGSGINNTAYTGARSFGDASGAVGGRSSGSRGEGYHFSGAMPSGTNPVSLGGADGRGGSTGLGGSRNASFGAAERSQRSKNDLKDIARMSAKIAANSSRSANEGARPFLGGEQLAGTTTVGGVQFETASSSDFSTALPTLTSHTTSKMRNLRNTAQEREQDVRRLALWMAALVGVTILASVLVSAFCQGSSWWALLIRFAVAAGLVYFARQVWGMATDFRVRWDSDLFPNVVQGVAGLSMVVAGLTLAFPAAVHGVWVKMGAFIAKTLGGIGGMLKLAIVTIGTKLGGTLFQHVKGDALGNNDKK